MNSLTEMSKNENNRTVYTTMILILYEWCSDPESRSDKFLAKVYNSLGMVYRSDLEIQLL
ncbi:hypothetical protein P5673_031260 [Acropora cervicornis]|uniref:Uncharacterized protein n=1 Tax=Acropora cervicornis TaxID=6130 RepID=A0AAD9USL6_ACRCE|nr:hypothetical protein P5673_031260 [Acropora cervicornis]